MDLFHPWYCHAIRGENWLNFASHGWHGDTTDEKTADDQILQTQKLASPISRRP